MPPFEPFCTGQKRTGGAAKGTDFASPQIPTATSRHSAVLREPAGGVSAAVWTELSAFCSLLEPGPKLPLYREDGWDVVFCEKEDGRGECEWGKGHDQERAYQ